MVKIEKLTVRQWTPYRDQLLTLMEADLGATKIVRKKGGVLSLRGGKMVVEFDTVVLTARVVNRERGGAGSISFDALRRIENTLFWWVIDNRFHDGEVQAI